MCVVDQRTLDTAAAAIEQGRLVVIPTARWYMLCCNASDSAACERIFAAKRRPANKSLLLAAPSTGHVYDHFLTGVEASRLIEAF